MYRFYIHERGVELEWELSFPLLLSRHLLAFFLFFFFFFFFILFCYCIDGKESLTLKLKAFRYSFLRAPTFLNDILVDFPPSDRREIFTTCWA